MRFPISHALVTQCRRSYHASFVAIEARITDAACVKCPLLCWQTTYASCGEVAPCMGDIERWHKKRESNELNNFFGKSVFTATTTTTKISNPSSMWWVHNMQLIIINCIVCARELKRMGWDCLSRRQQSCVNQAAICSAWFSNEKRFYHPFQSFIQHDFHLFPPNHIEIGCPENRSAVEWHKRVAGESFWCTRAIKTAKHNGSLLAPSLVA